MRQEGTMLFCTSVGQLMCPTVVGEHTPRCCILLLRCTGIPYCHAPGVCASPSLAHLRLGVETGVSVLLCTRWPAGVMHVTAALNAVLLGREWKV